MFVGWSACVRGFIVLFMLMYSACVLVAAFVICTIFQKKSFTYSAVATSMFKITVTVVSSKKIYTRTVDTWVCITFVYFCNNKCPFLYSHNYSAGEVVVVLNTSTGAKQPWRVHGQYRQSRRLLPADSKCTFKLSSCHLPSCLSHMVLIFFLLFQ